MDPWPRYLLHLDRSKIANLVQRVFPPTGTVVRQHTPIHTQVVHVTERIENIWDTTCFCGLYYCFSICTFKSRSTWNKLKKRRIARTFSRLHLSADTIWFRYRGCHSDRAPRWCEPLRLQYAWNEVIRCVIPPQCVFRPLGFIPLPPRASSWCYCRLVHSYTGWIHSETVVQLLLYISCLSVCPNLTSHKLKVSCFVLWWNFILCNKPLVLYQRQNNLRRKHWLEQLSWWLSMT